MGGLLGDTLTNFMAESFMAFFIVSEPVPKTAIIYLTLLENSFFLFLVFLYFYLSIFYNLPFVGNFDNSSDLED